MCIKNRIGPKTGPYGTPKEIFIGSETHILPIFGSCIPFILSYNNQQIRKISVRIPTAIVYFNVHYLLHSTMIRKSTEHLMMGWMQ